MIELDKKTGDISMHAGYQSRDSGLTMLDYELDKKTNDISMHSGYNTKNTDMITPVDYNLERKTRAISVDATRTYKLDMLGVQKNASDNKKFNTKMIQLSATSGKENNIKDTMYDKVSTKHREKKLSNFGSYQTRPFVDKNEGHLQGARGKMIKT